MFDFWDHPHALLSYSKKKSYDCEAVGFHPLARIKFLDEQKMQQFAEMISIREPTISNVIGFMDGLGLATEMTDKRIQQNAYYCGYDCDTMVNSVLVFGPDLGCAFRFLFRFFLPGLIFRNSGYSAKFPDSGGTHVGIKSFQGKINLLRNSGSGIPEGRTRDLCHNTIHRTTILLQFSHTIQCCLWCLNHHRLHRQPPYAAHDIPSQ